jgi:ribonuclease BN (tRNA processing enzyme)
VVYFKFQQSQSFNDEMKRRGIANKHSRADHALKIFRQSDKDDLVRE